IQIRRARPALQDFGRQRANLDMEFAGCAGGRRFPLRSLAAGDGRKSRPHPRRYRRALDVSLPRYFSGDLGDARGHALSGRLSALVSPADRVCDLRERRFPPGARRLAADGMAYVDASIVIDALGPPMMKTANGRKRLPLNNSNSSARSP